MKQAANVNSDSKLSDSAPLNEEIARLQQILNEYDKALMLGGLITKTDPNGIITFVSNKFCELSGYHPNDLLGRTHTVMRDPSVHKSFFKDLWSTIKKKEIWSGVLKNKKSNGETFFAHTTIIPILDTKNEIIEYMAMRHDISELISGRKVFQKSYKIDMLTGIGNRMKLFEDLKVIKKPMIALINIRYFKEVNSIYGVEAGDKVLEELAGLLEAEAYKSGIETYRLNGDEFALLSDQALHHNSFQELVVQLGSLIEQKLFKIDNTTFSLKLNMGISLSPTDPLLHADIALKEARKNNRFFVVIDNTSSATLEYKNSLIWKNKIIHGIKDDRFVPFYQPIFDNQTGQVESYEALIRFYDNNRFISPVQFLEIAKYADLYGELTKIMIRKTFEYCHHKDIKFSLNLNIEDIQHDNTRLYLKNMLYQYGGIQRRLTIELVESEGIENFDEITEFIQEMRHLGCQIAIDDFGSGYSNFEYLMKLNVEVIKIDGSLIQGMMTSENTYNVVETIVQLAKKNKLKTVAEFVSSAEIHEAVKKLGIDFSQGFYLKEPSAEII